MRSKEACEVLGCALQQTLRLAYQLGTVKPKTGRGHPKKDAEHIFSPGDVLAMAVLRSLGRGNQYVESALKVGEALDSGYPPAYLVTRGGPEHVVVIESEDPGQTDEMVAALLMQASDAGCAVRVVKLRPMVAALAPYLRELQDA